MKVKIMKVIVGVDKLKLIKSIDTLFALSILSIILFSTSASGTPPGISNINVSVTDISANITFDVNQSDANTIIHFGTAKTIKKTSDWNNDTSITRTITLSGLLSGKTYYYSIYAYNGSDPANFSNFSPIQHFNTIIATINDTVNTPPIISNINVHTTSSTADISFSVDQNDATTRIYYGTGQPDTYSNWNNDTSITRTITLSNLLSNTSYNFSIYAHNGSDPSNSSNLTGNFLTKSNISTIIPPSTTGTTPEKTIHTIGNQPINFTISFDQIVNVTWYLNGTNILEERSIKTSKYYNNTPSIGTYNITAIGNNDNGSISYSWTWIVDPQSFGTGNRIWDGSKGMSTTYFWNSFSFAGFYYDIDNNLSTEELKITDIKRTIDTGDIVYTTSPIEVDFDHSDFGKYQVIGFMADKYFAGYTGNSIISGNKEISTIDRGQLHKVIIDDDSKRTLSEGSTLTLEEGYILKLKSVDIGAGKGQIWITLLKDGSEVDNDVVMGGDNYIYTKKIGSISDVPIIAVHFDSVFRGREVNAAFVKGIFQISEIFSNIENGNNYGKMEISDINKNEISMKNKEIVDLSSGSTIDLMGDLKIIVADDDNHLRFALSVKRNGTYDVRGTVYPVATQWTPNNFGLTVGSTNIGFYYDLDDDIGTESLKIESMSGRSIPKNKLVYSTSPQEVSFGYPNFGKYQVIGFMADKYFAGYTDNSIIPGATTKVAKNSVIERGELHKVLLDEDAKRTISTGSTLSLKEGYVLKATDIDRYGRTMLMSLLKDGTEVDSGTPLSAGQTYVYTKRIGSTDLPLVIVRFDSVFSGTEVSAAFLKGIFQISESITPVKIGDSYDAMEVRNVNINGIEMDNKNSIDLSPGSITDIMGNISFKVADDSNKLRFYPFVTVTQDLANAANKLVINSPTRATAGDAISINVTANGVPIDGVSIAVDPGIEQVSNTSKNGSVNIIFQSKGIYNITATKIGYEKTIKTIEIVEQGRLSLDVPIAANQFEKISIKVTSNGNIISNGTVAYDGTIIGSTDNNGILNYTLESSSNHTISASKSGYISVSKDIYVKAPYADFKAQNINIIPGKIPSKGKVLILSNITNIGTKADTMSIKLIVNDTFIADKSIYINPKEMKEINFTYDASLPEGNYTVQILDQIGILEIEKQPFNLILVVAIFTIIAAIAIYIFTAKEDVIRKYFKK